MSKQSSEKTPKTESEIFELVTVRVPKAIMDSMRARTPHSKEYLESCVVAAARATKTFSF